MTSSTTTAPSAGILSRPYLVTTLGTTALVFLTAFESLAVTTVMPVVSADLGGRGEYATAFAATLAASVLGMVVAGGWADRRGPGRPLLAAIAVFAAGLLAAALAPTMGFFVAARFLQGLGAGGINVTLYVVVALVFPPALRPAVFGAFASAWVLPSLVGPFLAALVAQALGWPWVFSGVLLLVLLASAAVLPALLRVPPSAAAAGPSPRRRFVAAAGVAGAVVVLSSAGSAGPWRWVAAAAALAVLVVAVRPLLPPGSLTAQPGLPATVALRGLLAAAFFSTEVYLPLMLHERFGLELWLAGATLTAAAVAWASGAAVQGRLGHRLPHARAVRTGSALLLTGVAAQAVVAAVSPGAVVAGTACALGWFVAGAGMGLAYPRTTVLVLEQSPAGTEGAGSAALTISDATGGGTATALTGLAFGALGAVSAWAGFAGTLPLCAGLAVLALLTARRVSQGTHRRDTAVS
ncbi:MFS transporter [Kineococcus radiotolerans]|uniref:Major facilitator superfamily MFS_1 n=1 Tax=Kineococcus radiotolerans (strain ATCC BAA-149 / DSM 14245 / SRS30216) TaxID=266940 RepID=A6WF13_KINRD|nr:MFS transporter [Kineococcus radiotolerans]ABS05402.1 major facilitator superfamily MFS_1 [Kineococcus radiotolerans SRS30216 = ATCC BAA-149]